MVQRNVGEQSTICVERGNFGLFNAVYFVPRVCGVLQRKMFGERVQGEVHIGVREVCFVGRHVSRTTMMTRAITFYGHGTFICYNT